MQLLINEIYPIDRRRNGGAKPRNIEVSRDKRPFAENNVRTKLKKKKKLTGEFRQRHVMCSSICLKQWKLRNK